MTTQKQRTAERVSFILDVLEAEGLIDGDEKKAAKRIRSNGEGRALGRRHKQPKKGANSDE